MKAVPTWAWVVLLAVGTVVIGAGVTWWGLDTKYTRELEAERAKIRAAGEPLTMAEAAPKADSPETNAATLYMQVLQVSFDPGPPHNQYTGLLRYPARKVGDMATAEAIRPVLADPQCQADLRVLRQASRRPQCAFPVRWEDGPNAVFPHLAQMRQATRLTTAQAMLCAKDGRPDEAVEWLCTAYRLADHASLEPTLIGQLVAIAVIAITNRATEGILNTVDLTAAQRARLRAAVDRLRLSERFYRGLLGERAMGLQIAERGRQEPGYLARVCEDQLSEAAVFALKSASVFRPYLKLEEVNYLRAMAAILAQARRPARETTGTPQVVQPSFGRMLSAIMVPRFSRASLKRDQTQADLDLLRTALELKTYRAAHGSYPPRLPAPGVTVREDVLSGKPLGYRQQGQGFVIWSVGPNLRDDGGQRPVQPDKIMEQGDLVWACNR